MKHRICWEDIPSIEGVSVEWDFKPSTPLGKRAFARIKKEDIPRLYTVEEIFVKVATVKHSYTAILIDISAGGLAMLIPAALEENQLLKVGFHLGSVKIVSKAAVRHSHKIGAQYIAGIEFVDFDSEYAAYINGLYASLVLCRIR